MAEDYSSQGGGTYSGTAFNSGGSSSDPANKMPENQPGVNIPAGGSGTYKDPKTGQPITREQAMATGVIDKPTDAGAKLQQINTLNPQDQSKMQMLQSPTAQWGNEAAFQNEAANIQNRNPNAIRPGTIFQGNIVEAQRQRQPQQGYTLLADPRLTHAFTLPPNSPQPQNTPPPNTQAPVYVKGIGLMVSSKLVEEGKQNKAFKEQQQTERQREELRPIADVPGVKYNIPHIMGAKISQSPEHTAWLKKAGEDLAKDIISTTDIQTGLLRMGGITPFAGRVAGNVVAGFAALPAAVEIGARTAMTTPAELPATAAKEAGKMFMGTMGAFDKAPLETAVTLYVGAKAPGIVTKLNPLRGVKVEGAPAATNAHPITAPADFPFDFGGESGITAKITPKGLEAIPRNTVIAAAAAPALVYQGISAESGKRAQPLIGVTEAPVKNVLSVKIPFTDKTLVIGTPNITPAGVKEFYGGGSGEQFGGMASKGGIEYFQNPTEMKIATENILKTYDPATQELFKDVIAKRELTYGTPATHKLSDVPLEEVLTGTHGLKPETTAAVREYMQGKSKEGDLIIWGSSANKALVMGKGGVGYFREIGDIDIHVRNPAVTSQELFNIISKTEAPGTVTPKGAAGLATNKGTLFDIKNIEGGAPEVTAASGSRPSTGDIFGFKREIPETVGPFKTVSLSEQTTSKMSSVALRENTISAHAGRAGKDPFDLSFINEPAQTAGLEQSWNPYTRLIKAPRAKALDTKIQEAQINKIKAQPEGTEPGKITPEQKALFFENVEKMRSGQIVASTPEKTLLYSPMSSESSLAAGRQAAYVSASAYAAGAQPGSITEVIPPHSPSKIRTQERRTQAEEMAKEIVKNININSPDESAAYTKGPDIFRRDNKLLEIEYFNRTKEQSSPAARFENKSFGSQSLTGSPANALSNDYYGSLAQRSSMSGGDAGTYTPQWPYYDVPRSGYQGSGGGGSPGGGSPGGGSPRYTKLKIPHWKTPGVPGPTKRKKSGEDDDNITEIKIKNKFFKTSRKSPIAAASFDISGLRKAMGLTAPKKRRRR